MSRDIARGGEKRQGSGGWSQEIGGWWQVIGGRRLERLYQEEGRDSQESEKTGRSLMRDRWIHQGS